MWAHLSPENIHPGHHQAKHTTQRFSRPRSCAPPCFEARRRLPVLFLGGEEEEEEEGEMVVR